jgi:leader peptidase (prepilin peptidase)/N-methyltransferase
LRYNGNIMLPDVFFSVALFLVGLGIGSFANVVIYRVPLGLSIVKPRSFCPQCKTTIRSFDNLPLVSWLILRGRCRYCGCRISPTYFLVELACGALFVAVYAHFAFAWDAFLPLYLLLVSVTLTVGMIDLEKQIIPNRIILPALLVAMISVGVIALVRGDHHVLIDQGIGLLFGAVPLGLIALFIPRGMGMGDAKLMAFAGVILGLKVLPALFLGFLLGTISVVIPLATGRKGWKERIPFGPFLVLGCWISIFAGDWIIDLYKSFIPG